MTVEDPNHAPAKNLNLTPPGNVVEVKADNFCFRKIQKETMIKNFGLGKKSSCFS